MHGHVLVIGTDHRYVVRALELLLPDGLRVRGAETAEATEGLGVDVVVVAGSYPLEELAAVRVHSTLGDKPVVIVAPGLELVDEDWRLDGTWLLTRRGSDILDELARHVARLAARSRHPAGENLQPIPTAS